MVHRDVKPQNVLVDRGDFALLADFGLTRALGDQGMTKTGDVVGSIHYISPEQIRGQAPSAKSDLYAFAAVLFQCLAGDPPFTGNADAAVIYGHMSEPPPHVSAARPELSHALDAVVARGLAKDPDHRYATARELVDAATSALSSPAGAAPEDATRVLGAPDRSPTSAQAPPRRRSGGPGCTRRGRVRGRKHRLGRTEQECGIRRRRADRVVAPCRLAAARGAPHHSGPRALGCGVRRACCGWIGFARRTHTGTRLDPAAGRVPAFDAAAEEDRGPTRRARGIQLSKDSGQRHRRPPHDLRGAHNRRSDHARLHRFPASRTGGRGDASAWRRRSSSRE